MENQRIQKSQTKIWLLMLSLFTLLTFRTLPLLYGTFANYGYDYGFYLFAIKHTQNLTLSSFFTALWGGYNNPLFYIGNLLHIPASITLNELYFFASLFTGLCFYFVFAKKNWQAGIFACLLFATSKIQAEMYNIFLWKNVLALSFLLLSFKFLEERRWKLFIFSSLMILLTHRTTAIIYILTLLIYFTHQFIKQKKYKLLVFGSSLITICLATSYTLLPIKSIISNLINNNNSYVRTGLFLENQNLFAIWWPFLALALPGIFLYLKNRRGILWPIFTTVCLLWVFFHLPFYRRIIIYLDIAVIYFSAHFLNQLNFRAWQVKTSIGLIFIFLLFSAQNFIRSRPVWISSPEIEEIKKFKTKTPGNFVLAVSANDAPWLLGFGNEIRLTAPGLFEDRNTYEQWQTFWAGQNQKEFLWKYPRPLYFYQRSYKLSGEINNCLSQVSKNFFEYNCK